MNINIVLTLCYFEHFIDNIGIQIIGHAVENINIRLYRVQVGKCVIYFAPGSAI